MSAAPVPFHVPYRTGHEEERVADALAGGSLAGNGRWTQECQRQLEAHTGAPRVLLTHSCTAALELAAMLCGWGTGDEVIVPSFAFTSTAAAVARTGASPVFAEVDPSTMMLDVDDVRRRITPKTRGILPIHYAGLAAPIEALDSLAAEYNIDLVEDAAQSIDARLGGRQLGTFGRFGCLSFHETKNIHCGLGGALIINQPSDIESAEFTWERGTNRSQFVRGMVDKYTWVRVGSSFYPSEMQAAFLSAQLDGLAANTASRNEVGRAYDEALTPLFRSRGAETRTLDTQLSTNSHAWFAVLQSRAEAEALRLYAAERDVALYTHYVPLHSSPVGVQQGFSAADLPVTESASSRLLRLPVHTALSVVDVEHVIGVIRAFYEQHP